MNQLITQLQRTDRIGGITALIVVCFVCVLLLSSQSAASLPTYVLTLVMFIQVREWKDVFRCPLVWPVLALLVYLPLTALWSPGVTPSEFFSVASRALLTFTFVVAVAECQLRGKILAGLGYALGFTGAAVAALCILLFYLDPPSEGRMNGLGQLDTEVVAALVFGATSVLVVHLMVNATSRQVRLAGCLLLVPLLAAVALSGSRNALVSVTLGLAVLLLANTVRSRKLFLVGCCAVVGVMSLAGAAVWSMPELQQLVLPRGDSFRLTIWTQVWERVLEKPWFGHGILANDDAYYKNIVFQHPHNLFLAVAYQGGFFGLALFLWLIVRVLRESIRAYSLPDAKLVLGLLAVALPSYLLDGHELLDKISDTWFLFWLPVAVALGLRWHVVRPR